MPDVSVFCPVCGRAVDSGPQVEPSVPGVGPLSRDALLGAVAYVAILPALLLLVVPAFRTARFIRFHAWQSLLLAGATVVIGLATRLVFAALTVLPMLGFLLVGLVGLAILFVWLAVVVKAGIGDAYEIPLIGKWAAGFANRE